MQSTPSRRLRPSVLRSLMPACLLLAGAWTVALAEERATAPARPASAMDPQVRGVDLELSFDPETGDVLLQARLTIEATGVAELEFEINPFMTVERVTTTDGFVEHRKSDVGRVKVWLDPPLEGRRVLAFRVSGRPLRGADPLVRPDRLVLGPADRWYPTLAGTWASARIRVEAPEGWTVIGPGRPSAQSEQGAIEWRTAAPVRSLAVVAAPGLALGDHVTRRVPVRIAADASVDTAAIAERLRDPLVWFTSWLGAYPFDGFNLVLLPGLEHRVRASGLVVVPAGTAVGGDADAADLIAGQWFGERLAGDGAWIDAFAAWAAVRYARDRVRGLPAELARLRREYFELSRSRDVPLSQADELTPEAVVRGKGSAAPEMVRLIVGERRAERAVQELFQGPVGPPIALADVRAAYERHAGATLLRAFSDWFDRKGVPELEVALRTMPASTGGWRADLTVLQRRGSYALPLELVFHGRGGEVHRQLLHVDDETTTVFYELPFDPARVEVDPLDKLFRRKSG